MVRRALTKNLTALFLFLLTTALAASAQSSPPRLASPKEIHDILVDRIDVQHKSVGIVVGVINKRGQEVIGYGKLDEDDPRVPDGNTVFEIGSITKVFTSLLLCDMVVHGELRLSDPVQKYLPPSVHMPTRNGKQITLLDLATHHSGLPRMPSNFNDKFTPEQMYDFLSHYELTRDPGAKYEYSNLGVGLLGNVLAIRAGTDYETLLHTRITGPLHMDHTAIEFTPEQKENLAVGHDDNLRKAPYLPNQALIGAGMIRSTANDMLIFLAANMGLIQTPLEPAIKKMLSVHKDASPGAEIALGWHILPGQNRMVLHNGGTAGFHSLAAFEPHRKLGIVVLSNSTNDIDDMGRKILDHTVAGPVERQVGPAGIR
jgi:D-alanyl-D-alanine-carboxypeptidase/D-alanyl-D-alanine-endopeptidase